MASVTAVPDSIAAFFDTPTPDAWLDEAAARIPELLLDHANCELKAASTALGPPGAGPVRRPGSVRPR